jgi:uncharacterized protein (TIGR03435 family)
MKRASRQWLAWALAFAGAALAQSPAATGPSFEVASIKPAPAPTMAMATSGQLRQRIDDGMVDLPNISLMNLISMAYETNQDYITGPGWLESQNFSVTAKLPAGSSKSQVPAMLQRMLADRFKLEAHHSEKVQPVYLLTLGKQGRKFKESADTRTDAKKSEGRPGAVLARSITMAELAQSLTMRAKRGAMMQAAGAGRDDSQRDIDLPVVDQTGLSGTYDIDLVWDSPMAGRGGRGGALAPSNPQAAPAADIFKALEAVGLKLEQAKRAFDILVVDHVEKVPTEN